MDTSSCGRRSSTNSARTRIWSRTPSSDWCAKGGVLAYPYKGYWSPADTVKERAQLEELYQRANCPWMVWDPERSGGATPDESDLAPGESERLALEQLSTAVIGQWSLFTLAI